MDFNNVGNIGLFICQVGFPIFFSVWAMTKGATIVENNTKSLDNNTHAILELKENCKYRKGA